MAQNSVQTKRAVSAAQSCESSLCLTFLFLFSRLPF
uniref:Uncharacterized protein n=1 Tax=Anguilla anguilla TaxID=7936 RepID=A0A0E9W8L2_ANGAN